MILLRLFVLLLCSLTVASAQTIPLVTVIDRETASPIEGVAIYNKGHNGHVLTDSLGLADLSQVRHDKAIHFQHTGYKKRKLTLKEIDVLGYVIKLEPRSFLVDEVVITTGRSGAIHSPVSTPQAVRAIMSKDIQLSTPQTSADMIANTGSVLVQKSQSGGGSPMIRGFAANRVLMVIDGVRINNAIYRSGNVQNIISVDANSLERSEILFGPGSVMYGSDALGGVMLFETARAKQLTFEGNAFSRYSSANNEKTGHLDLSYGLLRWAFHTSLTFSDFNDLRTGANRYDNYPDDGKRDWFVERVGNDDERKPNDNSNLLKPSAYDQFNLLQKIQYYGDSWDAAYSLLYSTTSDINRYDRLIQERDSNPRYAEWYYGPQEWLLNNLRLSKSAEGSLCDRATLILAHQRVEESRHDRAFNETDLRHRTEQVNVFSLNADLEKSISERRKLFYGLELVHNDVTSEAENEDIVNDTTVSALTRYPDGGSTMTTLAAYVSHRTEVNSQLSIIGGLRYSQNMLLAEFEDSSFYSFPFDEIDLNNGALTASLGAILQPGNQWRINASIASGFRAPNVDDAAKVFDSEPGGVVVPNPDLSSEYAYSGELGISKSFENRLTISSTGWYTRLTDVMVRRDFLFSGQDSIFYDGRLSRVQAVVNAGDAYLTGAELNLRGKINAHWSYKASAVYTAGRDLDDDVPMRHVPPFFASATLAYEWQRGTVEGFVHYNNWKSFEDLSPSEQDKPHIYTKDGTPPWWTFNLRGSYSVARQTTITTALENILDQHYRPFSSGISAPGRNFVVSLRQSF